MPVIVILRDMGLNGYGMEDCNFSSVKIKIIRGNIIG